MIQLSPSWMARVLIAAASEPAFGSVRQNAAIFLPRAQVGQVAALLRFVAAQVDRHDADADVRADEGRRAGADAAHRLHQQAVAQLAQPGAAVLLREWHAQQAVLAQLAHHVHVGPALDIHLFGRWAALLARRTPTPFAGRVDGSWEV